MPFIGRMKNSNDTSNIVRKTISLSHKTLEIAQKNADTYFSGNLSAYLAYLVMQKNNCVHCTIDNSNRVEALLNNLSKKILVEKL